MNYQQVKRAEPEGIYHVGELHVPPVALVATFGEPSEKTPSIESMGEYYFRSANGEHFVVYVLDPDVLPKDLEKTKPQFWLVTDPVPFSIGAERESDVEEFKHWIQVQIKLNS